MCIHMGVEFDCTVNASNGTSRLWVFNELMDAYFFQL